VEGDFFVVSRSPFGFLEIKSMFFFFRRSRPVHILRFLLILSLLTGIVSAPIAQAGPAVQVATSTRTPAPTATAMCQGVLDTRGESLVSFDKHSPGSSKVFGALMPTRSGR